MLVLSGLNLNPRSTRKPEVCGSTSLADLERMYRSEADKLGLALVLRQFKYEGQPIGWSTGLAPR